MNFLSKLQIWAGGTVTLVIGGLTFYVAPHMLPQLTSAAETFLTVGKVGIGAGAIYLAGRGGLDLFSRFKKTRMLTSDSSHMVVEYKGQLVNVVAQEQLFSAAAGLIAKGMQQGKLMDGSINQTVIGEVDFSSGGFSSLVDQLPISRQENPLAIQKPVEKIMVSDLIQHYSFGPSRSKLLVGMQDTETPVLVNPADSYHIAIPGPTGIGKTNIERLLMMQLAPFTATYYISPTYADVKNDDAHTDFRAIRQYLSDAIFDYNQMPTFLQKVVDIIKQRQAQERKGELVGWEPIWIVIDELPAIINECGKDIVVPHIARILREGRQYKVFAVIASQDFQVQTIGIPTGAQDCFRTVIAPGLDSYSKMYLFGKDVKLDLEFLNRGEKGNVIVGYNGQVTYARVPYVDNASTYQFLQLDPPPEIQQPSETYHGDSGPLAAIDPMEALQPRSITVAKLDIAMGETTYANTVLEWWHTWTEKTGEVYAYIVKEEALQRYAEWCSRFGKRAETPAMFYRITKAAMEELGIQEAKPTIERDGEEKPTYIYFGRKYICE